MMGMGQQMPMRRPQMGPSPMTAGRPNPMAGFQGGGGYPAKQMAGPPPNMGGGTWNAGGDVYTQNLGGNSPPQVQGGGGMMPMAQYDTPQVAYPQGGMSDAQMHPFAPRNQGATGVGPNFQLPQVQGGGGPTGVGPNVIMPGAQGMNDAMMHPFAPRNRGPQGIGPNFALPQRPQFPGAMQGGIMGGMGPGMTPPWMRRQYQGL